MALEITLLGPPRVARDGEPVGFETRKAMALLAHLALAEHPRSREALCELLYPGHDPDRARGALRRTLSTLRKGVGEEWIAVAGDSIALQHGPGLNIDVERFRALVTDGASPERLSEAVVLFGAGFLEGFSLRDSPDFDDWQSGAAGALERELASTLRRLVEGLAARGDFEQAIPRARRWLELDSLHEPAHRELIRLYAWSGERAAALEQYRTCVRTLSQELGVAPLEETTMLYAQVNDGSLTPPAKPAPLADTAGVPARARPAGGPVELPLVGRANQLAALLDAHATAQPDGRLAVVEGEAGIGKTRLADELAAHARAGGAVVLAAHCHADEVGLPYGPVVELLRAAVSGAGERDWPKHVSPQHLADAALLLPELATLRDDTPDQLALDGPAAQVRLLEGVAAVIGAACEGRGPGIVFVDDVHAADEATLDAVSYLGRRLPGRALLLVVTWRSEAVPPGHRLRRLAVDLARAGTATIVSPARLDADEVAALVRAAYPGGAPPDLEQRVQLETEGLPLFVAEYLAALRASGDSADVAFPSGILDARLTGIGGVARQVLGAAAAIGRTFALDTVRRASGRSDDETVAALEELGAHGLVLEAPGAEPGYDFAHAKLREHVYEQTGLARRRLLHGRVAAALSERRPDGASAALLAHHLQLAGDDARAAEQHRLAAEHAASLHAHADALEHLEAALALGYPDVAAVSERIGDLLTLLGDYGGALARYEAAAAQCEPTRLAAIEPKLGGVHQRRGEWERAETHFGAALDITQDPGLRARIHADLALTLHHAGNPERAGALAREALALAEAASDRRAQAQAHNMLGVLTRSEGECEPAVEHLELSLELARELGDAPAEAAALNNLALLKREAGELDTAVELTERALALCARYGDRHREAALENNLADLHHAAGRQDESMRHLKRAVTIFSEIGADQATRLPDVWKLVSW
jgi:DNA-binding SARP family transcriptional activator